MTTVTATGVVVSSGTAVGVATGSTAVIVGVGAAAAFFVAAPLVATLGFWAALSAPVGASPIDSTVDDVFFDNQGYVLNEFNMIDSTLYL